MVNTTYNSTEDMINKLQSLKGKSKLKFYKNISNYYNEMKNKNFQTHHEDTFSKNAQGISRIYLEVLLLMKFLQTKPQIKNMNINYYVQYHYHYIQYQDDDNDYVSLNDVVIPNHYVGIRGREI